LDPLNNIPFYYSKIVIAGRKTVYLSYKVIGAYALIGVGGDRKDERSTQPSVNLHSESL